MTEYEREALILACSRAKRRPGEGIWDDGGGKAPAILVYDGPWWKILRKHNPHVHVYALSGKFGLIPAHALIPHYDTKMRDTLSARWIDHHLLPHALSLITANYDTVWFCVPQSGGYATAVELVKAHLHQAIPFRDVAEVLELPSDENLLIRNPYFARTRALSIFCQQRGRNTPMPMGESSEDWQRSMSEGAILGW
ncbi:MAG: hypothetical protein JXC32_19725 [Anaerolineae bacterium]|nr:hypothetical protein [Anaerolineae bacterium]